VDVEALFSPFEKKLRAEGLSEAALAAFKRQYTALVTGETGLLPEASIAPVASLPTLDEIRGASTAPGVDLPALLRATVVLKLNGGLGTSMGLEKAKSLLPVKDGKTFLDLIAAQVAHFRAAFGSEVTFTLMNSFSTSDDTKAALAAGPHAALLAEPHLELLQNKSPKVEAATLAPAAWVRARRMARSPLAHAPSQPANPALEWCPPGHGDIYAALAGSGMLEALLADGKEYMFVSNSDNLGATLDLDLLAHFAGKALPFLMECADRTAADKKGGHLAKRASDGGLLLRESAQCPPADEAAFQDVGKHKYFNTNNLWINLPALKALLAAHGGALPLPVIQNSKTVDPRDKKSTPVLQLETAMGAAIEAFSGAGAVVVPRSRFAPVKTCADLLLLRSDAYVLTPGSTVELAPGVAPAPLVKLDDAYKLVDALDALVPCVPSLKGAASLTVKGPCRFGTPGVVCKGAVTFTAAGPEPSEVAAGEYTDASVTL